MKKILLIYCVFLLGYSVHSESDNSDLEEIVYVSVSLKELYTDINSSVPELSFEKFFILTGNISSIVTAGEDESFTTTFSLVSAEWRNTRAVNQYKCIINGTGEEFQILFYGDEYSDYYPYVDEHDQILVIGKIIGVEQDNNESLPVLEAVHIRKL
jgi:hypothetical protein